MAQLTDTEYSVLSGQKAAEYDFAHNQPGYSGNASNSQAYRDAYLSRLAYLKSSRCFSLSPRLTLPYTYYEGCK